MKKRKLNLHPSKVWGLIYPIFAKEVILYDNYETFAKIVGGHFILDPQQWEAVLTEWEFIHFTIFTD